MLGKIPIEFIPGFWVTLPEGIQGRGSGFLLAENIRSVIAIDVNIPNSRDNSRNWTILKVSENELGKETYLIALTRIITETWLDTHSLIIIGSQWGIYQILERFLQKTGGLKANAIAQILHSKLG